MKGRRTTCIICGNDAGARRPRRFRLTEYQRGQTIARRGGRSAGYLCDRCGDVITNGDLLTTMRREANTLAAK